MKLLSTPVNPEETPEDCQEVGRHATDDPEPIVLPPARDAHTAPPQLGNSSGNDGEEESKESYA